MTYGLVDPPPLRHGGCSRALDSDARFAETFAKRGDCSLAPNAQLPSDSAARRDENPIQPGGYSLLLTSPFRCTLFVILIGKRMKQKDEFKPGPTAD